MGQPYRPRRVSACAATQSPSEREEYPCSDDRFLEDQGCLRANERHRWHPTTARNRETPRSEALKALASFVFADITVEATMLRVTEITVEAIPGAMFAGMALLARDGKPTTAVSTDVNSGEVDEAQYSSGHGPGLDAWRTAKTVIINDMGDALDDYPEFARLAMQHDIASALSLAVVVGENGLGALNLYARNPNAFDRYDAEVGEELATIAAMVVANATNYWSILELGEGLKMAMLSRAIIEQAKGILMATSVNLDADSAFDVLRRASQRENVKLREIAQRIVDRKPTAGLGDMIDQ